MEIEVVPEPSDDERAALVEALASADDAPGSVSEWLRAALREGVETEEP